MKVRLPERTKKYKRVRKDHINWKRAVLAMICVVAFCTVDTLVLPAITIDEVDKIPKCGKEEHIHDESCYTQVTPEHQKEPICSVESLNIHHHTEDCRDEHGKLKCGSADFVIHQHEHNCYDEYGKLWCPLPEIEAHTHDESCFRPKEESEEDITTNTLEHDALERNILESDASEHSTLESDALEHSTLEQDTLTNSLTSDAKSKPLCGKEEIIPHEHTDECFKTDEEGNRHLICNKIEVLKHQHHESCFKIVDSTEDEPSLTCQLEESSEHQHGPLCYGTWELTCPLEEHIHSEECFSTPEVEVEAVADTAADAALYSTGQTWGYNDDGSIWWGGGAELRDVTEIEENVPYIIAGYQGNNLMTGDTYIKGEAHYLAPILADSVTDYGLYQRWCFEKDSEDGKYYIYYINNTKPDEKYYLSFAGEGVKEWNKSTQQLTLVLEKELATSFTVEESTLYSQQWIVGAEKDGTTYYINSYFGDKTNGNSTHWLGYPEFSEGSSLKICRYERNPAKTANRVETVTSANTVINLFDYWTTPNRFDVDNRFIEQSGINSNHEFKFTLGKDENCKMNQWTGSGALPRQGIVARTLEGGYPVLSGNPAVNGTDSTESLAYLFDPSEFDGKASYRNVSGLLTIDSQGYYAFDSKKNMAEFNEESNSIFLYDKPGVCAQDGNVSGQFFPFNAAPEIMEAKRDDEVMHHYFGLTLTTRFIQKHGGYTDEHGGTKTTFHFSGDDDVWIFIDGVLVGDVGGIHDASSVDIDFSTGDVAVATGANKVTTNLFECYQQAGKAGMTTWSGNTFADNSTHTLKFFYLERGNYDSNLELKYNLTEIPKTAIYKVNQYGEVVPGATFAVYAADENYHMLSDKGGAVVDLNPSSPSEDASQAPESTPVYDDSGNLLDSNGNILARALYTGTTNARGEMVFVDQDKMPYSLAELEELFGKYFILREIKVPEGYRVVSQDAHLEIYSGAGQKILQCANTQNSGSRAAPNLQVTATDTIYLHKDGNNTVEYCDENGNSKGTLFAVVFKYTGEIDENGNATNVNDDANWAPVYGSDEEGYQMIDMANGEKSIIEAAIEAAKCAREYGDVTFTISSNSTMQLTMKNLPGDITTYYRMLDDNRKEKTRYTVAYYWTDQDSLLNANIDNTYRVYSYAGEMSGDIVFNGFERVFGADIQVPNLINKVFVQKVDENDNRINGATFALYSVQQQEDGAICYSSNGGYVPLEQNAAINDQGVITNGDTTIHPLKTNVTKDYRDGIHVGTTEFSNLDDGQYIIKEVKAPPGYKLNTADVMLLVTEDTIYANAGTEDDGVTVGRGPGYVASTLSQFASEGQIDNTLTWIYAQMKISQESRSFADIGVEEKIKGYLTKNNSSQTSKAESDAARTYLKHESVDGEAAFNYVPNLERTAGESENGAQNPTETRRLFTTVGWPYYEIYQDYEYGVGVTQESGANYEDWSKDKEGAKVNLMNLFSRSTYIRVTDVQETALTVKKVDASDTGKPLSGAKFRLYRKKVDGESESLEYYAKDDKKAVIWKSNPNDALVLTTDNDGTSKDNDQLFTGLSDGVYYLEEIQAPSGYNLLSEPIKLTIRMTELSVEGVDSSNDQNAIQKELDETTNLYTYTVTVLNSNGYTLPSTGGSGTGIYTWIGILMMLTGIALTYQMKKREADN